MQVIFVCTGNTCRSPMAEYLFRNRLAEEEIKNIAVASAGVAAAEGQPATGHVRDILEEQNIPGITNHRSKLVVELDISPDDLILAMTPGHKRQLEEYFPEKYRIFTLHEFLGEEGQVSDPFGADREIYESSCKQLKNLIDKLVQELEPEG